MIVPPSWTLPNARRHLGKVPKRIVAAAIEHLQSAIGISARRGFVTDYPSERTPTGPRAPRRDLPIVVKRIVRASHKYFEPAVLIERDRRAGRDHSTERVPANPTAARRLPVDPHSSVRSHN